MLFDIKTQLLRAGMIETLGLILLQWDRLTTQPSRVGMIETP